MDKAALREKYLSTKIIDDSINASIIKKAASFIQKYNDIDKIGLYIPFAGEADLLMLILKFPEKKFFIPKVKDKVMYFTAYLPSLLLTTNRYIYKYTETEEDVEIFPELIFVPAIAFDIRGYRLGRGKGHFDKYFAKHKDVVRIGLCTSDNLISSIPNESHDIKMHYIVTEDIILDLCH